MIRRCSMLLVAALLVVLAAGPALAGGRLVVSSDGHTWTPALTGPLFDPDVSWVPGDQRTATFYVGNRSGGPGTLAVAADAYAADADALADDIDLQVRRASGSWKPLAADGRAHLLVGGDLPAGADEQISVRAVFEPTSGNSSQLRRLPISFDVVLSQSAAVAGPTDDDPPGGGVLPNTGGIQFWVLVAGFLLIILGAATIRSALAVPAREDDDHDRAPL